MRTLEVRRHTYTKQCRARSHGSHLSAEGVELARRLGQTMGPFGYVATSLSPRTMETAIAMGFAVDDQLDTTADLWRAAQAELDHRASRDDPELHIRYRRLIGEGKAIAALGRLEAELWCSVVSRIPDNGEALFITHGGLIEPGLIVALPHWNHASWGRGFRHGEGVRLHHDGMRFIDGEVLHLDYPFK